MPSEPTLKLEFKALIAVWAMTAVLYMAGAVQGLVGYMRQPAPVANKSAPPAATTAMARPAPLPAPPPPPLPPHGKTHWHIDGGGGAGTQAKMTLEGYGTGDVRLRFVKSRIEFEMSRIPDGAVYFSGQRNGLSVSGVFAHSIMQNSPCAPSYSGVMIFSDDLSSFTLTSSPTRKRVEANCGAAFRPADVTRGRRMY